jgi:hypothetical protein
MAEFNAGTREQVKNGEAQYVAGDIVAKDAINTVGGAATRTKTVSIIQERDSNGNITKSKTILFVEKNGTFQPAASKRDGEWNFSDPDYPLMAGVADAELQKDLANSSSVINRTTNNGIEAELGKRMDVLEKDKNVIAQGNQNGADPWEAEDNGLTGRPNTAETKPLDEIPRSQGGTKTEAAAGTRNSFGNLFFPSDIAETDMDVIKFTMLEFKPRKIGAGPGGFGRIGKRDPAKNRKSIGTVTLPVPGGITDQNNADWGDGRINPLQAAGLDAAGKALAGGLEAGTSAAAKQFTSLGGENADATKSALKGLFSAAAVGLDPNEVLARTQGAVINPNLELLFKGPTLRPFNFTFQMGARNSDESDEIMNILRFFKQGGAPQRTQAQMLIKAPHTFQIEYLHRGENNKYLNLIKECALLSVVVNYTPNNNYATFANGAPVSIEMSLAFKELDPVFNDDYDKPGVGF